MRHATSPVLFLIALAFAVGACQPTVRQPSQPHPSTNPASVRIYQKAPHAYEDLGVVEAAGTFQYGPNSTASAVVDALKAQAAAKGANAIWLFPPRGPDMIGVGAFYNDQYYTFPFRRSQPAGTLAQAIYVPE